MFAAFVLALTFTIVGAAALAGATPHDPGVSATDRAGHRLGENPLLRAGDTVFLTVTGFAPGAVVTVRTEATSSRPTVTADGRGVAKASVDVSARLAPGRHEVLLVGDPPVRAGAPAGNILVTVPRIGRFVFHVGEPEDGRGAGVAGVSAHRPDGDGGTLAHTGVDVASGLAVAALAIGLGVGVDRVTRAGRRRRLSARRADGTGC